MVRYAIVVAAPEMLQDLLKDTRFASARFVFVARDDEQCSMPSSVDPLVLTVRHEDGLLVDRDLQRYRGLLHTTLDTDDEERVAFIVDGGTTLQNQAVTLLSQEDSGASRDRFYIQQNGIRLLPDWQGLR